VAVEEVFVPAPPLSGRGAVIQAPFPWLFTGEDHLRVVILNSRPGVVVTLQGRFLDEASKTPRVFAQSMTPTSDRLSSTFNFGLGVGAMLNCSLIVSSGAPLIGQTYCMVQIIRGFTGAILVLGGILGGPITARQHLAYPGSAIVSSTEGEPAVRFILGTTPAAGASIVETCPTGARWELVSIFHRLTSTAGVGARDVFLQITDSGNTLAILPMGVGQDPSRNFGYTWAQNLPQSVDVADGYMSNALPQRQFLLAGGLFAIGVFGMQAGDQLSAPLYQVREWLEAN